jgi:hypothetical protein
MGKEFLCYVEYIQTDESVITSNTSVIIEKMV